MSTPIEIALNRPVTTEAVALSKTLVTTCSDGCFYPQKLPSDKVTLRDYQRAFPYLGACLMFWAQENPSLRFGRIQVLSSLAGHHHLAATQDFLPNYQRRYSLRPTQTDHFCLAHQAVGGQIARENEQTLLLYPQAKDWTHRFALKNTPVSSGHFAIAHFGSIVLDLGSNRSFVDRLAFVHRSNPGVAALFEKTRGQTIEIF